MGSNAYEGKSPEFIEQFESLVRERRSIRKYKPDPVPHELIDKILETGCWAPSGKNFQNWRFFVVTGKKRDDYLKYSQKSWLGIKDYLHQKLKPSLYQFTERFFYTLGDAPVIVFCYSKNDPNERYHTSIGGAYMAVQTILLAAQAHGLGTCPMGAPLEIRDEVDAFIGKEKVEGLELLCAITMGWPDHKPPAAPRQMEDRINWLT
jgi:nitroreductase